MTLVFILLSTIVLILVLPPLLTKQSDALKDVETSLDVRLEQLKRDFQFRSKELARRLKSNDLAEDEWQKLSDELQLETSSAIESTLTAKGDPKTGISMLSIGIITICILFIAYLSYQQSGFKNEAAHQMYLTDLLSKNPLAVDKLAEKAQTEKTQESLNLLYLGLRTRVELTPDNVDSWRSLARFNANYGRLDEAREAVKLAMIKDPANDELQIDMAQIHLQSQKREDIFKALDLMNGVLKRKPDHEGALLLLAMTTFEFGMYQKAIESWEKLQEKYPNDSEMAQLIEQRIQVARDRLKGTKEQKTEKNLGQDSTVEHPNVSVARLAVKIEIEESVKTRIEGDESLFIFAKSPSAGNFPVAVIKTSIAEVNNQFILSDLNAMRPDLKLSNFDEVVVTARITKSGDVIAKTGDFEGHSELISSPFDDKIINLVIDQEISKDK